ncbi:MAG: electron transport complex subunit E [Ruminococcaceae bacterium]|nr:electron transport complex subunit E [Oscillospiraceae bacterium]
MNRYIKQLKEGVLDNNPTLVQLLGMCPTLATTTSLENAFGMGVAATAVLICSNLFISLLRKFIPQQVRIAAYIVIISGFVTAVELLMRAYFYSLYQALGLFIPLIVVNCIILARAEAFASKNAPLPSIVDGVAMGLGFTFALCVLGTVRELLGAGSILGVRILPADYPEMIIFILPAGAFLTLGFVIAAVQKIRNTVADRARLKEIGANRESVAASGAPNSLREEADAK